MAINNFAKGRITNTSLKLLNATKFSPNYSELIWVPAHSGNPGNETAHDKARGFVDRAVDESGFLNPTKDSMITYHDLTNHFKLERRTFPPPHKSLTKEQEVTWRRLQTRSLRTPSLLAHIYPDQYNPTCKHCGQRANYDHILWDCKIEPPPGDLLTNPSLERWETVLASSDPRTQVLAAEWADKVVEGYVLPIT